MPRDRHGACLYYILSVILMGLCVIIGHLIGVRIQ